MEQRSAIFLVKYGATLEFRIGISNPQNGVDMVRPEINLMIWKALKEANITIPCPLQHVQITQPVLMSRRDLKPE